MNTNFIFYKESGLLHDIQSDDIFEEYTEDCPIDPATGTNYDDLSGFNILSIREVLKDDSALKYLAKEYKKDLINAILAM